MITDFTVLSGLTVPSNYTWDAGIPLQPGNSVTTAVADSTTTYISGYAPGVRVSFQNNSISDNNITQRSFLWDFGDYYNDSNNTAAVSCTDIIDHTYVMPGIYTVTLIHNQSVNATIVDPGNNLCLGKYDYQWYWDNVACNRAESVTWDQAGCNGTYAKWWSDEVGCIQKYCKSWSWYDLQESLGANPVRWSQTVTGGELTKKWAYEANDTVCTNNTDFTIANTVSATTQSVIKTAVVQVFEIPPVANLYSVTQPVVAPSPLKIQLTPRTTVAGSFPIDRIDWDPGDGTPVKTVLRHSIPEGDFVYTNVFADDPSDPRNYDLFHTYERRLEDYPVFYPSLTAYSSSTGTYDSCSTTIGPITLSSTGGQAHILKVRNSPSGKLYTLQVENNVTFVRTATSSKVLPVTTRTPSNQVRDSYGTTINYAGNTGEGYPQNYNPPCTISQLAPPVTEIIYLTLEDGETSIDQENDLLIYV